MSSRPFRRYPDYKDSGVEWLGEIPADWGVKRLKRVVQFQGGGTPAKENAEYWRGEIPWVSPKDMKVSLVVDTEDKITPDAIRESATKLIPARAVLIVVRSGILAHSIPVAIAGREVALNQDMKAMIPRSELAPEYLMYLIAGMQRELLFEWKKEGATVESLELESVACTATPLPAIAEQLAIATFLDRETARIDALVAKKQRLIELLQEQRTALITRAVTKGLNPTAPMKDSGVEWLGEIPTHWETERNRWLFRESIARSVAGEEELLTVSHLTGVTRRSEKNVTMIEAESHEGYKICKQGELAINTMWAWMGALGIAKEEGMVSPSYNVYRITSPALHPSYYEHLCRVPAHVTEITRLSKGIWGSRLRLYPEAFFEVYTPLPPTEEQVLIAASLDRETTRLNGLMARIRDAIDRLKELRTALISAAVTGKIDVRDEATAQPEVLAAARVTV